jgi:thiosulfate/3-mercaptopyruvate sulfurtransferase
MNLETISRRALISLSIASGLAIKHSPLIAAQEMPFPLLVDLAWLQERAQRPDLRLFDVSSLHVYRERHIDSAEHAWWRDTVDPNYPVFGAVLTQGDEEAHRQRVLDSLGLLTGDQVVVYDNEGGFRAARLVWFLRFIGFSRAALLDAGYDEWEANAFPIESASTSSTSPTVDPQAGYYLVSEQLLNRLQVPGVQIVDTRTDTERADDLDGNMPIGQIPGSIRLPWNELYDADGRLRTASDTSSRASALGLDPARETVLYGSFGVDTALSWLALRNAGFETVLSYDRGWAEWSTLPGAPREPIS